MNIRFNNYNKQRTQTNSSAANALSQLEGLLLKALHQQAYFHKDPDNLFSNPDDRELITKSASSLIPSWNVNLERVNDIIAVLQEAKTVDEVINKYDIDLTAYRLELE